MVINESSAKRLGIYFFYDPQGIVDRYIDYFLKDFSTCFQKLVIVCNGVLSEEGRLVFEKYTDSILVRENTGMDVWAYKTAFDSLGWSELVRYDEVTIANYTSMGPVYPFREMYAEMADRDLDLWGINKHFRHEEDVFGKISYGYIPEHIQSYYMVFRRSLVQSEQFQKYWDTMPLIKNYVDSIATFEAVFTKKFADEGFKWDVYVNIDDLETVTLHPILTYPVDLIQNRKCPIFKRRSFFQDYDVVLDSTLGQDAVELYEYLNRNQLYDMELIWENLLRTCHQSDLVKNLHLSYILPCSPVDEQEMRKQYEQGAWKTCGFEGGESAGKQVSQRRRVVLLMHLYFMDLLEESFHYASAVPEFADVYITTDSQEKKQAILERFKSLPCGHLEVRVVPNRGRDVSALMIGLKDVLPKYEIACFYHDKKAGQVKPATIGESFGYKCAKNVLYNRAYVYQVLKTFDEHPRLGLLSPPEPNHGVYFATVGNEWSGNYEIAAEVAERLGITVPMAENKPPVAPLGSVFWFRTDAMKGLHEYPWALEDFPEEPLPVNFTISHGIERIRPFVVQQAGYYPAYVMAEPFARIEFTNLRHFVQNYNSALMESGVVFSGQREVLIGLKAVCKGKKISDYGMPWYMKLNSKCKSLMPEALYTKLLRLKRQIFGPRNLL